MRLMAIPILPIALIVTSGAASAVNDDPEVQHEPDPVSVVRLQVPDKHVAEELEEAGVDLAHYHKELPDGVEIHAVLTEAEARAIASADIKVLGILENEATADRAREDISSFGTMAVASVDTLTPLRTEWFTSERHDRHARGRQGARP